MPFSLTPEQGTEIAKVLQSLNMGGGSAGNEYSDQEYWETRYQQTVTTLFDWYTNYKGLKPFLSVLLSRRGKDSRILNLGCGNSPLCEDMYDDGYQNIENTDYSESCIQYMIERNATARPGLKFEQSDARAMSLEAGAYDLVLDKGLVDSLMCGGGSARGIDSMCSAVARALSAGGAYVVMTYGPPEDRLRYFEKDEFGWAVEIFCLRKPDPECTEQEIHEPVPWQGGEGAHQADAGHGVHYLYLMRPTQQGSRSGSGGTSVAPHSGADEAFVLGGADVD